MITANHENKKLGDFYNCDIYIYVLLSEVFFEKFRYKDETFCI